MGLLHLEFSASQNSELNLSFLYQVPNLRYFIIAQKVDIYKTAMALELESLMDLGYSLKTGGQAT